MKFTLILLLLPVLVEAQVIGQAGINNNLEPTATVSAGVGDGKMTALIGVSYPLDLNLGGGVFLNDNNLITVVLGLNSGFKLTYYRRIYRSVWAFGSLEKRPSIGISVVFSRKTQSGCRFR